MWCGTVGTNLVLCSLCCTVIDWKLLNIYWAGQNILTIVGSQCYVVFCVFVWSLYAACTFQIFCGKIPKEIFEDELVPLFEQCGTIWDLRLMMDPATGLSRGYCFVTFTTKEAANEAVKKVWVFCMWAPTFRKRRRGGRYKSVCFVTIINFLSIICKESGSSCHPPKIKNQVTIVIKWTHVAMQ